MLLPTFLLYIPLRSFCLFLSISLSVPLFVFLFPWGLPIYMCMSVFVCMWLYMYVLNNHNQVFWWILQLDFRVCCEFQEMSTMTSIGPWNITSTVDCIRGHEAQCSAFKIYTHVNHLENLLKCKFWYSSFHIILKIVHFSHVGDANAFWSVDHT